MALILDESFDAGIPSAFATLAQSGGSPTVTYNSSAKAVDLDITSGNQTIWELTTLASAAKGDFELDLEMIADHSGQYNHAGIWMSSASPVANSGARLAHHTGNWDYWDWLGASPFTGNINYQVLPQGSLTFSAGDRRTLRCAWDSDMSGGQHPHLLFLVDGVEVFAGIYRWATLRPGVFFYHCAVRVHSVKVWDAPQTAFPLYRSRGFTSQIGLSPNAPLEALDSMGVRNISRSQVMGKRDPYFGGAGRITGSVKIAPNLPTHRKVRLFHEATGILIAETWSDATTGAYSFTHLDPTQTYTVIGFDYTQAYRAVIADRVVPELMS